MTQHTAPQVAADDVHTLLNAPHEGPVLYLQDESDDDGSGYLAIGVWAEALVPNGSVIARRHEVEDALGADPDADMIDGYLPYLQETVDEMVAELV